MVAQHICEYLRGHFNGEQSKNRMDKIGLKSVNLSIFVSENLNLKQILQ